MPRYMRNVGVICIEVRQYIRCFLWMIVIILYRWRTADGQAPKLEARGLAGQMQPIYQAAHDPQVFIIH